MDISAPSLQWTKSLKYMFTSGVTLWNPGVKGFCSSICYAAPEEMLLPRLLVLESKDAGLDFQHCFPTFEFPSNFHRVNLKSSIHTELLLIKSNMNSTGAVQLLCLHPHRPLVCGATVGVSEHKSCGCSYHLYSPWVRVPATLSFIYQGGSSCPDPFSEKDEKASGL